MRNLKNTVNPILSILVVLSITIVSCQKDRIEEDSPPPKKTYEDPSSYLDSKKQAEQEFLITEDGTGPVTGNQGTNIWISKACLELPDGGIVEYPYTIKLIELYTPKDMIYYQMPTIAGGKIMETEGEIRVRVFKDSLELKVKAGCSYQIEMPSTTTKNYLRVHYGFDNNGIPDWTDNPVDLGISNALNPVFNTSSIGYKASIAILGWINCGFQIGDGTGFTIAYSSTTDDLSNVATFCYLPDSKTVMQVYIQNSGPLPGGESIKTIGFAQNSAGVLYSFDDVFSLNANKSIAVTLSETTDAVLTAQLDGL